MEPSDFADVSKWEIVPNVAVFDSHQERNAKGDLVREFKRDDLDKICEKSNERDALGAFCPITLGHTKDNAPESEQPPIVGYARHFKTEWDDAAKRWVIRCAYYLKKDKAEEARKYPRTSVELWAKDHFFDPIALLIRTPQRDSLPQWTYSNNGKKLRYAMADKDEDDKKNGNGKKDDDGKAKEADEKMQKRFAKFRRRFAKRYAKIPAHHSGLSQYARKTRKFLKKYQGVASGTDTFIPGADQPTSEKKQKPKELKETKQREVTDVTKTEEQRIRDDQAAIERAQYQKRIDDLEKKDKERDAASLRYKREGELKQLLFEGFRLDVADELQLCEGMTDDQFGKHKERIKKNYMKNPPNELIRLARVHVEGAADLPPDKQQTTPEQHKAALKIATESSERHMKDPKERLLTYDEALAEVKKQQTTKAG